MRTWTKAKFSKSSRSSWLSELNAPAIDPSRKSSNARVIPFFNRFILGQRYFELVRIRERENSAARPRTSVWLFRVLFIRQQKYIRAYEAFDQIKDECYPALYQLAVILYDDLLNRVSASIWWWEFERQQFEFWFGIKDEGLPTEDRIPDDLEVDTRASFHHPNKDYWKYGFECMLRIAESRDEKAKTLIHMAQYNVGKALFPRFRRQTIRCSNWKMVATGCWQRKPERLYRSHDGSGLFLLSQKRPGIFRPSRKPSSGTMKPVVTALWSHKVRFS